MPIPITVDDLPPTVWRRVQENVAVLRRRRPLDREALRRLREQMRVLHTYHSNAIEGNTLTLRETQLVLEEGVTVGGKSLREHLEAANNARAFDWIGDAATSRRPLDHVVLQTLHEIVMQGLSDWAGRYRVQNVRIAGSDHTPPAPAKIVGMLDSLFADVRREKNPVLRSAYLHHGLVAVHPFMDGNGRVTRLATNLALLRAGYPVVVLRREDRRRYYGTLRAADRGDLRPFAGFLLRAVDEALVRHLSAVVPGRELLPLRALARDTPYGQEYLALRARQGVLEAVKVRGVWHSSREAVSRYVETHRRTPRMRRR